MKKRFTLLVLCFIILTQTGWSGTDNHSLIVHENNEAANIGFAARFFDAFQHQFIREFTTMGMMLSNDTVSSRVDTSSDDAEERLSDGAMDLTSSDLELINDPSDGDQIVGMRFTNITIPQGAIITNAYIEFEVDETDSGTTNLTFSGQDIDNAPTFSTSSNNISSRTPTSNTVPWNNLAAWNAVDQKQQTPDLSLIIQEIVDRGGWTSGNSLVILVEGSGERTAESYDGENANAPLLLIDYSTENFSCAAGIISNPDFESGLTGWDTQSATTSITTDAYFGSQAYVNTASDGGAQQAIAGTPGNAYGLSVYAKKTGTASPVAGIEFYDASWGYISGKHLTVTSTDWEEYSRTIVAPANTAYVMFSGRNSSGTGNAYFDSFCTEELVLTAPSCNNSSCDLVPHSNENIMVLDDSGNSSGTMDYDNADLMICDNGDGTLSIKGNIISGRDAHWDSGTGTPCGLDDAWAVDLTLSDMKTYADFTTPIVADASCDNRTDWDYWNIAGTFTGIGCNTGRTLNMVQHQNGYRIQIGWGASTTNCNFGLSTWFEGDEGGTFIQGDIYANLDEACYTTIRPETNPEICDNGIDDDGNGLVDADDPGCECPSNSNNPLFCLQSGEWSYDCLDEVCSEIVGIGNQGQTSAALGTGDSSTVQFIVVEATFSGGSGSPDQVTFSSSNGESITVDKQYFEGESGSNGDRYFQAELTTADSIFVDYPANATNRAESFVAYLFRDCADSGSYGKFVHTKLSGGESDTTHFVIPQGNETRDILIEVPLSELTNDGRIVNVHASAGGVSKTLIVSNYNQGNSLNLTPFTLENVPASADTVTIVVESPSGGQSVYLSGAVSARLECAARLTVNPSASVHCAAEGTSVTYSYNIINYGTNEINNITASDDLTGNIGLGTTTLQAGQSMGTTSSYTVQASDFPGPLFNTVIVSGTDAVTSEVITDTFQVEIPLVAASLTITADTTSAIVGDTITYTYQMQNLGSTALNLDLTDDLIGNVLEARVNDGLQVLYTFDEGSGNIIRDVSGVGNALDLTIETPANTTWGSSFLTVHTETRATNITVDNKIHQSCTASNEVSLEVWVKSLNNTQGGPARMLSYSLDSGNRNTQLSQDGNDYNGRLRTTDNDRNELDGTGNHIDSSPTWQHVVYTYDGVEAKIYVNGVHISDSGMDNPTGDFSTWNSSYALVLFNEYLASRDWLGDMGLAAIYSKALDQAEVAQNYHEGYENITGNLVAGDSLTWTSQYVVQSSDFPSPLNNQATLMATALEGCAVTVQDDVAVILCTNADCMEYCNDGIDNDGDGLTDCEDDDCVSISDGGMIDGAEKDCGAYDPASITNMDLPSNHNGNTIQYEWEQSTDFGFSWTIISGAVAESFDPATITITTRYRRKARLFDCDLWEISNEIIKKVVRQPTANNDSFDSCPGVTFTDNVSVNDSQIDAPTFSIMESTTNGTVSIDSLGKFTYTPSGVNCNTDQFSYQVCNDETSCCSIAIVTINLSDSSAPNLMNVPTDLTLECEETIPELPLVLAIDNCPAISITVDEVSTQTETGCGRFSYTITRTWLAADFCGNDVSENQIITVQDTTPPSFTVPSAAFLPCSENKDDLTITGDATDELDNCSTNLQAVYTDNESNLNLAECRGFITRTWTLTDLCGNTTTEDQLIYIFDDTDRDKDGTPDILDLDDDNDGIPDVDETYADTDGDGVTNNLDLDSDNDGIPDIIEAGFIDSNGNGIVDNLGLPGWDDDGDGFADGFDANDMDTSLVASDNFEPLSPIRDRDGDNVTNFWDLDSDNDGVGDLIETGGVDTNGDGIIDYPTISDPTSMIDADGDGFADVYDPDNDGNPGSESPNQPLITYNGVEYIDGTSSKNWDEDGDDVPNLYDLDGDNDGIADLIEAQAIDTDGDGKIDLIGEFEDANGDGFHDNYSALSLVTTDTDGATIDGRPEDDDADGTPYNGCDLDKDGIMNQLDLESDGDGILDIIEIGNAAADADSDGRLDSTTDSNKDGFDDNLAALGFITTDGDGATDDGRPEDDGDSDISPFSSSSADGWIGEANGEADIDDDGDAQLNFLDTDSDGDLIPDNIEDANQNGIQDAGETGAYDSDSDDDLIRDGTEDTNINGIFEVGETDPLNPNTDGDPLDDGVEDANQNGVVNFGESDPRDPCDPFLNESCIGVVLDIKIRLQGALMGTNDTLMRDDLRTRNLIPLQEPYAELNGFLHEGTGGGEVVDTSILMIEGPNAIVDWVLVELRDATEPSMVVATRSALLQRDGDVVDTSGLAPLRFPEVSSGSYYVAVRHRNHLGVMTYGTYILSPQVKTIDFRTPSTLTYGGEEAQYKESGRLHLWAGDINSDHKVIYQGPENDILNMFLSVLTDEGNINYYANYVRTGYDSSDLDMNGTTIYQGPGNDRGKVLIDVILKHGGNVGHFANYVVWEKMPD